MFDSTGSGVVVLYLWLRSLGLTVSTAMCSSVSTAGGLPWPQGVLGSSAVPPNPVARNRGRHWRRSEPVMGMHLTMGVSQL